MLKRIATALVLLLVFVTALLGAGALLWSACVLAVVGTGGWEWARLAGFPLPRAAAYGVAIAGMAALFALGVGDGAFGLLPLALYFAAALFWIGAVPVWLYRRHPIAYPGAWAVIGWAVLVPAALAAIDLRARSALLLLELLGVVWVADSAAYFVGRWLGSHKLAPSLSPGKTWEGVAGALLGVALYAFPAAYAGPLAALFAGQAFASRWGWITLAFWAMTGVSIIGDLLESALKRHAGTKDSGTWLPGHGGVLDRIDSLSAGLPLAALVLILLNPAR